jgi:hypothetical protein
VNFLLIRLPQIDHKGLHVVYVNNRLLPVIVLNSQTVLIVRNVGNVTQQQFKARKHGDVVHDDEVAVVREHQVVRVDLVEGLVSLRPCEFWPRRKDT